MTHRHTLQRLRVLVLGVQGDTQTHVSVSTGIGTGCSGWHTDTQWVRGLVPGVQGDTQTYIKVNKVIGTGCSGWHTVTHYSEYRCWCWAFRVTHRHALQWVQVLVLGVQSDTETHIAVNKVVGTGCPGWHTDTHCSE